MYYVIEIQEDSTGAGIVVNPIQSAPTKNEAMSKYHGTLRYAAVSSVYQHTVVVMAGDGRYIAKETYIHPVQEEVSEE